MKKTLLAAFVIVLCSFVSTAQDIHLPSSSPTVYQKQDFALSNIELSYSRPSVKGRRIFGDLVPYGKVWRTGANGATTISFGQEVIVGGKKIAAGQYGLLTIPGEKEWTVILTKQTDVTNPAAYKMEEDLVRVTVPVMELSYPVETLTILFGNITAKSCDLQLLWDKKMVSLPIQADIDSKIQSDITQAMTKDNRPYFQAAVYYLDNGKDLNQSLEWFNKAIENDPDAFYMYYQRARCLAKMGKKSEALSAAQKGIEQAKKAGNSDYVALNEKLIATLK